MAEDKKPVTGEKDKAKAPTEKESGHPGAREAERRMKDGGQKAS